MDRCLFSVLLVFAGFALVVGFFARLNRCDDGVMRLNMYMYQCAGQGLSRGRRCEPVRCRMYCRDGWERDSRGCEICRCRRGPIDPIGPIDPLPRPRCPAGSTPTGQTCSSFRTVTRCSGRNTFCQGSPFDGPGTCCKRRRRPQGGRCPRNNRIGICAVTRDQCYSDRDCRRQNMRCCPAGCGRRCVRVNRFPWRRFDD